MKIYKYNHAPLEVHGLPFYEKNQLLQRLPAETIEKLKAENPTSGVLELQKRCPGARICFRTNAKQFTVTPADMIILLSQWLCITKEYLLTMMRMRKSPMQL